MKYRILHIGTLYYPQWLDYCTWHHMKLNGQVVSESTMDGAEDKLREWYHKYRPIVVFEGEFDASV